MGVSFEYTPRRIDTGKVEFVREGAKLLPKLQAAEEFFQNNRGRSNAKPEGFAQLVASVKALFEAKLTQEYHVADPSQNDNHQEDYEGWLACCWLEEQLVAKPDEPESFRPRALFPPEWTRVSVPAIVTILRFYVERHYSSLPTYERRENYLILSELVEKLRQKASIFAHALRTYGDYFYEHNADRSAFPEGFATLLTEVKDLWETYLLNVADHNVLTEAGMLEYLQEEPLRGDFVEDIKQWLICCLLEERMAGVTTNDFPVNQLSQEWRDIGNYDLVRELKIKLELIAVNK